MPGPQMLIKKCLSLLMLSVAALASFAGDVNKPAILLVHGLAGGYTKWDQFITYLPGGQYVTGGNFMIGYTSSSQNLDEIIFEKERRILKTSNISESEGYVIYTIDFKNNQGLNFKQQGQGVRNVVNRLVSNFGHSSVILVGHSMGGLAVRACLMHDTSNISGLVTVSSPNVGSYCGLVSEFYDERQLRFTPYQLTKYSDFVANQTGQKGVTENITKDFVKWASSWDAIVFNDGMTMLDILDLEYDRRPSAKSLNFITDHFFDLRLNSPAVQYLIPNSPEMIELYSQRIPSDLPVAVVISKWDQGIDFKERSVVKDELKFMYMKAKGFDYLGNLKRVLNTSPAMSMGMIEQSLKQKYLQRGEDLYPEDGMYYLYTDGVVTTFSQDLLNGISNPEQLSRVGYFGSNKFHTKVPEDVEIMKQALEFVINAGYPNQKNLVRVGLILDSSGSMRQNDPGNLRIKAAESVISILREGDEVFIVDFDDSAVLLNTGNTRVWKGQDLNQYFRKIDASGGTNIGAGLKTMQESLDPSEKKSEKRSAVLLITDGQGDYQGEAAWFAEQHIPVYTISYKEFADAVMMDSIANLTKGVYIRANDQMDVFKAFIQFYNEISGYSTIFRKRITQNGFTSQPVFVDESAEEMIVYLNNLNIDPSQVGFKSPDGIRHTLKETALEVAKGMDYLYARIKVDIPGMYTYFVDPVIASSMEFYLYDTEQHGSGPSDEPDYWVAPIDYTFEVSTNTAIGIGIQLEKNESGIYQINYPNLIPELEKIQASTELTVISPKGNISNHKSKSLDGSMSFYPMDGKGNYTIEARFSSIDSNGNDISRFFLRSLFVGTDQPGYIGKIYRVMGNYIYTYQGLLTRNKPGITVQVFDNQGIRGEPNARGYVTEVNMDGCIIELQEINRVVEAGDIVFLNMLQWKGD